MLISRLGAALAAALCATACAGTQEQPAFSTTQGVYALRPTATTCPFSDAFTGKTLNPGWTVSSPNPDSKVRLTGKGWLLLRASPKNGGSDLYPGTNYNAPLILQPVTSSLNWTITTELKFSPTNNYQGAGILLATQAGGFNASTEFSRVIEHAYYPNGGGDILETVGNSIPYPGKIVFLRLVKNGTTYTAFYKSTAHAKWTQLSQFTLSTSWTWIGLFSIRYAWDGNYTVYSNAYYNYFDAVAKGC